MGVGACGAKFCVARCGPGDKQRPVAKAAGPMLPHAVIGRGTHAWRLTR